MDDLVETLNFNVDMILDQPKYFPTAWHKAKAVADQFGGKVDEPEPDYERGEFPDGRTF